MGIIELRPHHLLDIVRSYEPGREVEPAASGNAVHEITRIVDKDLDAEVRFVLGADDICRPCRHLQPDGVCERVLDKLNPPVPMQEYNDRLDGILFCRLDMEVGETMTIRGFLEKTALHMPEAESLGTLSGEAGPRFKGLADGLKKLGIKATPFSEQKP